jgi:hypothetical protein
MSKKMTTLKQFRIYFKMLMFMRLAVFNGREHAKRSGENNSRDILNKTADLFGTWRVFSGVTAFVT